MAASNPFMALPDAARTPAGGNPFMSLPDAETGKDKQKELLKQSSAPATKSFGRGAASWAIPMSGDVIPAAKVAQSVINDGVDAYAPDWAADYIKPVAHSAVGLMNPLAAMGNIAAYMDDGEVEGNSLSERFDSAKRNHMDGLDASFEEHPLAYGSGVATGLVGSMAIPAAGWTKGAGVAKNLGTLAAEGAALGGSQGFADGYTLDERIEGGMFGAGFGAVAGAGAGGLGALASKMTPGVKNGVKKAWYGLTDGEKLADMTFDEGIKKSMMDYGTTSVDKLKRGNEIDDPEFATLNDIRSGADVAGIDILGRYGHRMAKNASNLSTDADVKLSSFLDERQEAMGDKIKASAADAFGGSNDVEAVEAALKKQYDNEVSARYRAAENNPDGQHIWTDKLQNVLSTSVGEKALRAAIKESQDRAVMDGGEMVSPVFNRDKEGRMQFFGMKGADGKVDPNANGLSFRFWDSVKKKIDDDAGEAGRAGRKYEAGGIGNMARTLRDEIDTFVPEYAHARKGAASFFGAEDALEAGRKYAGNMNSFNEREVSKALAGMGPAEKQLFARSFAAEIANKVDGKNPTHNLTLMFKTPKMRAKMREVMGDQAASVMEGTLRIESIKRRARDVVKGGSDTAKNMMQNAASNAAIGYGVDKYMGTGSGWAGLGAAFVPKNIAAMALRGGYKAVRGKQVDAYAKRVTELMTETDPEKLIAAIQKAQADPEFNAFLRAVDSGAPGAAASASGHGTP